MSHAYQGTFLDAICSNEYELRGVESYDVTMADKDADKAMDKFVEDPNNREEYDKAMDLNYAARRAGYFAGWKHAAQLFMELMALANTDVDGTTQKLLGDAKA